MKRYGVSVMLAWCADMDAREGVSPVEVPGELERVEAEAAKLADEDQRRALAEAAELLAKSRPS